ncbi:MAG: nucleotidyltransferase family protein [Chitinophagaceae bacterium]
MTSAVQDKKHLFHTLKANSTRIKSFGVKSLGVFGSFANGIPDAASDVDFLVGFDPEKKTFDNFMELSFFLEELLGRKVEIVTPQSLNRHIGPHILNNAEYVSL